MALIVGHSQVKYLHEYIQDHSITTLAYPGSRVEQLWSNIEDIVPSFEVFAILTGANDLPKADHQTVLNELQKLCENIHELKPRAKILVCDILPRAQSYFDDRYLEEPILNAINTEASTVNFTVHLASNILPWLDSVEFPLFLHNHVIQRHMLSRDGLHLSFRATRYVAETIVSSILKYFNVPEANTAANNTKADETVPTEANDITTVDYTNVDDTTKDNITEDYTTEDSNATTQDNDNTGNNNTIQTDATIEDNDNTEDYDTTYDNDPTEDNSPENDNTTGDDDIIENTDTTEGDSTTKINIRLKGGGNGAIEMKTGDKFSSFEEF